MGSNTASVAVTGVDIRQGGFHIRKIRLSQNSTCEKNNRRWQPACRRSRSVKNGVKRVSHSGRSLTGPRPSGCRPAPGGVWGPRPPSSGGHGSIRHFHPTLRWSKPDSNSRSRQRDRSRNASVQLGLLCSASHSIEPGWAVGVASPRASRSASSFSACPTPLLSPPQTAGRCSVLVDCVA
jgi:hypothetical protein